MPGTILSTGGIQENVQKSLPSWGFSSRRIQAMHIYMSKTYHMADGDSAKDKNEIWNSVRRYRGGGSVQV